MQHFRAAINTCKWSNIRRDFWNRYSNQSSLAEAALVARLEIALVHGSHAHSEQHRGCKQPDKSTPRPLHLQSVALSRASCVCVLDLGEHACGCIIITNEGGAIRSRDFLSIYIAIAPLDHVLLNDIIIDFQQPKLTRLCTSALILDLKLQPRQ